MGKDWPDLAGLPWLATPAKSAHRRLLDDIFRPFGPLPKRVGFTDQEEAMIDFVESGVCLSLARDSVIERVRRRPQAEFRRRRQGGADLRPQLRLPRLAAPGTADRARLHRDAGGVGREARQDRRRRAAQ